LIDSLKSSKEVSISVTESLEEAQEKSIKIEEARSEYKEVSVRGSIIFFVIADLAIIDPMYQFSLIYFQ